jgi:hypothetical protein
VQLSRQGRVMETAQVKHVTACSAIEAGLTMSTVCDILLTLTHLLESGVIP